MRIKERVLNLFMRKELRELEEQGKELEKRINDYKEMDKSLEEEKRKYESYKATFKKDTEAIKERYQKYKLDFVRENKSKIKALNNIAENIGDSIWVLDCFSGKPKEVTIDRIVLSEDGVNFNWETQKHYRTRKEAVEAYNEGIEKMLIK